MQIEPLGKSFLALQDHYSDESVGGRAERDWV